MKYLAKLLCLAVLGLAVSMPHQANAQLSAAVPNLTYQYIAASASYTNSSVIDCRNQSGIGVQLTTGFTNGLGGLPAGAMLWYFYRTADGVTYDSIPQIVGTPAQTTGTNTFSTNLVSSGLSFFKVVATNTIATTGLTSTVTYVIKKGTAQ